MLAMINDVFMGCKIVFIPIGIVGCPNLVCKLTSKLNALLDQQMDLLCVARMLAT